MSDRDRPWLMRTYSGHTSAKASNELYRRNLAKGQTGLSVAFDLPTQNGYDADHPLARGEVGKVGVPISGKADMRALFDGIPLAEMNTSMTINATAAWLLALYIAVADEQGADPAALQGTTQNDILKEYLSRGTYVFPPEPSLRLTSDVIAYTVSDGKGGSCSSTAGVGGDTNTGGWLGEVDGLTRMKKSTASLDTGVVPPADLFSTTTWVEKYDGVLPGAMEAPVVFHEYSPLAGVGSSTGSSSNDGFDNDGVVDLIQGRPRNLVGSATYIGGELCFALDAPFEMADVAGNVKIEPLDASRVGQDLRPDPGEPLGQAFARERADCGGIESLVHRSTGYDSKHGSSQGRSAREHSARVGHAQRATTASARCMRSSSAERASSSAALRRASARQRGPGGVRRPSPESKVWISAIRKPAACAARISARRSRTSSA